MKKDAVIALIRQHAADIGAFGAASVYLFGSTARDNAADTSDVDLFIDRQPGRHVGFVELTDLQFYLENLLETDVDLTTRSALHPSLRHIIEAEAIKII